MLFLPAKTAHTDPVHPWPAERNAKPTDAAGTNCIGPKDLMALL
jgi:hypothetical protein